MAGLLGKFMLDPEEEKRRRRLNEQMTHQPAPFNPLADVNAAELAAGALPVLGGALGAGDEWMKGNYGWSAFNAATVPLDLVSAGLLGGAARSGAKVARGAAKAKKLAPEIPNPTNDPYAAKIQEQFEIARRNAAKPVKNGGLGLPPDNTAADRAQALGFTHEGYHYSSEIDDLARYGFYRPGVHWTSNPRVARERFYQVTETPTRGERRAEHAKGKEILGGTVPLRVRIPQDGAKFTDDEHAQIGSTTVGNPDLRAPNTDAEATWFYANSQEVPGRKAIFQALREERIPDWLATELLYANRWRGENIPNAAPSAMTVNPANIRARNAAFDPFRRHEPDLMATLAAFGLLGGGLLAKDQNTD